MLGLAGWPPPNCRRRSASPRQPSRRRRLSPCCIPTRRTGPVFRGTKSGTNAFHGNAQYWWNGRYMNANDWFNNATGTPRPFSNSNQWAASLGGPLWRNHTFFFLDHEALRFVLPNVESVTIPTPEFA